MILSDDIVQRLHTAISANDAVIKELEEKDRVLRISIEKQRREEIYLRAIKEANIPKMMSHKNFANFKNADKCLEKAKKYITKPFTIFTGNPGVGKSHLAIGCIDHYINRLYLTKLPMRDAAYYTRQKLMLVDITSSFNQSSKISEKDVINKYTSFGLLVIDELGKANATEYAIQTLFEILISRYESGRKTILVSNMSYKALCQTLLGQSLQDRFRNDALIIDIQGESKR